MFEGKSHPPLFPPPTVSRTCKRNQPLMEIPSADDIHDYHAAVVEADPETEPGIRNAGDVEFAVDFITKGHFGQVPETIHEKAAHLLRLIAASHPYVDGNKRTALTAVAALYDRNGYELEPDDQVRAHLKSLANEETAVEMDDVTEYLRQRATER